MAQSKCEILNLIDYKARKGIPPKENLMDRMDTTELIANQFRMSQTREKLKRENIRNQKDAMEIHEMVGKKYDPPSKRLEVPYQRIFLQ